jgi:hypothetical protein
MAFELFYNANFPKKKKSRFEAIKENKTTQNGSWQNNH